MGGADLGLIHTQGCGGLDRTCQGMPTPVSPVHRRRPAPCRIGGVAVSRGCRRLPHEVRVAVLRARAASLHPGVAAMPTPAEGIQSQLSNIEKAYGRSIDELVAEVSRSGLT